MAEVTPHLAPIVILLFLGTVFATGITTLVLLFGMVRRSRLITKIAAGVALAILAGYGLLLCAVSLASHSVTLPMGGWKYFCEIDCHIGYSVEGMQTAATIGPENRQVSARGRFVIVQMKVWFDPHTISPTRGDGPLTPNARRVALVDARGQTYTRSSDAEAVFARTHGEEMPLRRPLRPGQSFLKHLVFDVPKNASGLRLLITEDDPETILMIGHENSLWHKKIYLGLDSAPSIPSTVNPLASNL
jgi:hypothetical protein